MPRSQSCSAGFFPNSNYEKHQLASWLITFISYIMRQFIRNIIVFSLALYMCLAKRNYFFQQLYFCSISFHNFMLPVFPFYLNTPFARWRTGSSTVTQQQYKSINSNDIGCLSVIHCQDIGNNKVHVLGNLESSHQDDGSWVDVKEVYQKARSLALLPYVSRCVHLSWENRRSNG